MTSQKHELKHINWIDIQMIYITAHSPIYYMTYDIYIYIFMNTLYILCIYLFIHIYLLCIYIFTVYRYIYIYPFSPWRKKQQKQPTPPRKARVQHYQFVREMAVSKERVLKQHLGRFVEGYPP